MNCTQHDLLLYLRSFPECTVLVLGDVMLDQYISGDVLRISPEAPIPVLTRRTERATLGGAANVASNIAALGARAVLLGVVGDDQAGRKIRCQLQLQNELISDCMISEPEKPTTVKTRFMSGSHQLLRVDEEDATEVGSGITNMLLQTFERVVDSASIVVLSDYAKGVLSLEILRHVIQTCRLRRKRVIADPKRVAFASYMGVDVLTPNVHELRQATGALACDDLGIETAGRLALAQSKAGVLLVTRSERGISLIREDCAALHIPTCARDVADVSGAGDTLVSTLSVMLASGATVEEAAVLSNLAAGVSVEKQGTATVTQAELAKALGEQSHGDLVIKSFDCYEARSKLPSITSVRRSI